MGLSHKIFQRATIRGIADYLLYGNGPDEDSETYEERLDETYLEFEKAVFQFDKERSYHLLNLANAMTCEVASVYMEIAFYTMAADIFPRAPFALWKRILLSDFWNGCDIRHGAAVFQS